MGNFSQYVPFNIQEAQLSSSSNTLSGGEASTVDCYVTLDPNGSYSCYRLAQGTNPVPSIYADYAIYYVGEDENLHRFVTLNPHQETVEQSGSSKITGITAMASTLSSPHTVYLVKEESLVSFVPSSASISYTLQSEAPDVTGVTQMVGMSSDLFFVKGGSLMQWTPGPNATDPVEIASIDIHPQSVLIAVNETNQILAWVNNTAQLTTLQVGQETKTVAENFPLQPFTAANGCIYYLDSSNQVNVMQMDDSGAKISNIGLTDMAIPVSSGNFSMAVDYDGHLACLGDSQLIKINPATRYKVKITTGTLGESETDTSNSAQFPSSLTPIPFVDAYTLAHGLLIEVEQDVEGASPAWFTLYGQYDEDSAQFQFFVRPNHVFGFPENATAIPVGNYPNNVEGQVTGMSLVLISTEIGVTIGELIIDPTP